MATVLDELERLDKETTPGPWRVDHNARIEIKADTGEWSSMIAHVYRSGRANTNAYEMPVEANAKLITAMRNALPSLLAAARAARQYLDATVEGNATVGHQARLNAALAPLLKQSPGTGGMGR